MSSKEVFKSARLKIDRASEHIADINTIIQKERPFRMVLQTNAKEGRRTTSIETDEAVVDRISIRCGEAVQHLSSALDYAFGAVVRRHLPILTPREEKAIQFPFSETAARLKEACHNRLAHKVSPQFVEDIISLAPHGEAGGNKLLYFISSLNNPEKHAQLIPVRNLLRSPYAQIAQKVPDFPSDMRIIKNFTGGASGSISVDWRCHPFTLNDWVIRRVPSNGILKEYVDVPLDVTFRSRSPGDEFLAVPTLHQLTDVVRIVLKVFARYA